MRVTQTAVDLAVRAHEQACVLPANSTPGALPPDTKPQGRLRVSMLSQVLLCLGTPSKPFRMLSPFQHRTEHVVRRASTNKDCDCRDLGAIRSWRTVSDQQWPVSEGCMVCNVHGTTHKRTRRCKIGDAPNLSQWAAVVDVQLSACDHCCAEVSSGVGAFLVLCSWRRAG